MQIIICIPTEDQELIQGCQCSSGLNLNLEMLIFEEREKPEFPEKNLSEQKTCREATTNSTHIHV